MNHIKRIKLAKLALQMGKQSKNSFLITPTLIDCFDAAITEPEADFLLKVGLNPHRYEELRDLSGRTEAEFRPFFDEVLTKYLMVQREDEPGVRTYELAAIVVGWVEFVLAGGKVDPKRIEFTKSFNEYFKGFRFVGQSSVFSAAYNGFQSNGTPTLRVRGMELAEPKPTSTSVDLDVPVKKLGQHIHPGDAIMGYLDKADQRGEIGLIHCFCRQWRKIVDEPCRFGHASASCISVGFVTTQLVEHGVGRKISKEEAIAIVEDTRRKGAVHTIFHDKDDLDLPEIVICNCCWDCCGFLGSFNRGLTGYGCRSHYLTKQARTADCILCNRCVRYCPAGAISLGDDGAIHVREERCIGCGQCAYQCPRQVYDLVPSNRDVHLPILRAGEARIPVL